MKTFREMRIGDVCYEVRLTGIYQHVVQLIDCTHDKTCICCSMQYHQNDNFFVDENESIATSKSQYSFKIVIYADEQLAKEKLYELRDEYMKHLHQDMINAINKYEDACKIFRCYSDCNLPEDFKL